MLVYVLPYLMGKWTQKYSSTTKAEVETGFLMPKSVNGIRSIFALHDGCYQAFVHKYSLYNTRGSVLMNAD